MAAMHGRRNEGRPADEESAAPRGHGNVKISNAHARACEKRARKIRDPTRTRENINKIRYR